MEWGARNHLCWWTQVLLIEFGFIAVEANSTGTSEAKIAASDLNRVQHLGEAG